MQHPERVDEFTGSFKETMSNCTVSADLATDKLYQLLEAMHTTALATFGKRISKRSEWFKAKSSVITLAFVAKWNAFKEYKHLPNKKSLQSLRNARKRT